MTDTPVLKAEHLGISFGGLKAVSDFDIQIGQNELVGLIGPNGAGKTTIFNLLTGVYQPTEGVIYLNGKSMAKKKPNQMVKEGIARTFQNIRLFKELSVLDNVKVAFNQGMSYSVLKSIFRTPSYWKEEAEIDRKARELLAVFHMEDKADSLAQNLPYGQQRKLEIARALATNPKLLLLDEHTAALDPGTAEKVLSLTRKVIAEQHITCLMVTHNMHQALELGNRTLMMDAGRIVLDIQGEERSGMTVEDLLEKFSVGAGKALDNDRILLSTANET